MHEVDRDKFEREQIRWRILKALESGRPFPTSEMLILQVLQDVSLQVTPHSLRRELDYLESRSLVELTGKSSPVWAAELTRLGVDLVEYTVPCEPGIGRPPKWY